jgi:hypothetical protein
MGSDSALLPMEGYRLATASTVQSLLTESRGDRHPEILYLCSRAGDPMDLVVR